jgi:putative tricarboxylic transport membrane protein
MLKRTLLALLLLATAGVAACGQADRSEGGGGGDGASYPKGRLSIMAPADPGGGWDETARALQDSARDGGLAKSVEVYNVPGAGGTIGLSQLASKRSGDPNQLMVMGLVMLGAIEQNKSPVDLTKTTPIASLTSEPEVVVVPAKSEFKTIEDLMDAFKADPKKVSFAGGSAGGTDQLLAGLMAKSVGVDGSKVKYVAYSGGGEAKAAILSGSVAAGISGVSEFADQVEAGKMRALAVSTGKAVDVGGKQVQTLKDAGYDVEITNWRGIVAPPGLSDQEKQQVTSFVQKLHDSPAWQKNLDRFRWDDEFRAGAEFDAFLKSETTRVQGIAQDLGLSGG